MNMKLFRKINSHVLLRSYKVVFIYHQMKGFNKERGPNSINFLTEPMNQ